jgi:3-oxoacyl-[acyl-carrier-protein] synthase-3
MTKRRAAITGAGMYVPDRVVTNDDLTKLMDTSDEWIQQRSGIRERRYVDPERETPADLAAAASRQACERAGIAPDDLDCILLATLSSQADFPGTSFFVHDRLGVGEIPCLDQRAQCSGFLYGLQLATSLVEAGTYARILVVGCEVHSTGLEMATRGRDVSVLFGDGSGAVVVEANDDPGDDSSILEVRLHAEGRHAKKLWVPYPSSAFPGRITPEIMEAGGHYPKMEGRQVFKHAVSRMPEVLLEALNAASAKLADVDLFLFHQANLRINEYVAKELGIPPDRVLSNIERYGNCSSASIPMLLAEAQAGGQLEKGKLVAMTAFGSGFTWASAIVRW